MDDLTKGVCAGVCAGGLAAYLLFNKQASPAPPSLVLEGCKLTYFDFPGTKILFLFRYNKFGALLVLESFPWGQYWGHIRDGIDLPGKMCMWRM